MAVELGARAVTDALKAAGLTPQDVDLIVSATVTGLAVPSLDARVAGVIGLRPDVDARADRRARAAWPERRAWPGCTTTWSDTRTRSRS